MSLCVVFAGVNTCLCLCIRLLAHVALSGAVNVIVVGLIGLLVFVHLVIRCFGTY